MVFGHVVFGGGLSRRAGPLPQPNHQVPKYHTARPPGGLNGLAITFRRGYVGTYWRI